MKLKVYRYVERVAHLSALAQSPYGWGPSGAHLRVPGRGQSPARGGGPGMELLEAPRFWLEKSAKLPHLKRLSCTHFDLPFA